MQSITGEEDAGELPVIIYRFLELRSRFVGQGTTFDLCEILRFQALPDQPVVTVDLKGSILEPVTAGCDDIPIC